MTHVNQKNFLVVCGPDSLQYTKIFTHYLIWVGSITKEVVNKQESQWINANDIDTHFKRRSLFRLFIVKNFRKVALKYIHHLVSYRKVCPKQPQWLHSGLESNKIFCYMFNISWWEDQGYNLYLIWASLGGPGWQRLYNVMIPKSARGFLGFVGQAKSNLIWRDDYSD